MVPRASFIKDEYLKYLDDERPGHLVKGDILYMYHPSYTFEENMAHLTTLLKIKFDLNDDRARITAKYWLDTLK